MTEIIAQFNAETSRALRSGATGAAANEVLSAVRASGATIEPLHPDTGDPGLSRYFVIRVPDKSGAEELARQLRSLAPTEAAYTKPAAEAP